MPSYENAFAFVHLLHVCHSFNIYRTPPALFDASLYFGTFDQTLHVHLFIECHSLKEIRAFVHYSASPS